MPYHYHATNMNMLVEASSCTLKRQSQRQTNVDSMRDLALVRFINLTHCGRTTFYNNADISSEAKNLLPLNHYLLFWSRGASSSSFLSWSPFLIVSSMINYPFVPSDFVERINKPRCARIPFSPLFRPSCINIVKDVIHSTESRQFDCHEPLSESLPKR